MKDEFIEKHYVTIFIIVQQVPKWSILEPEAGKSASSEKSSEKLCIYNREPEKCKGWHWIPLDELHKLNLFESMRNLLKAFPDVKYHCKLSVDQLKA